MSKGFSLPAKGSQVLALAEMHFIVFIWGFTAILGKLIQVEALNLVWNRVAITGLFLGAWAAYRRLPLRVPTTTASAKAATCRTCSGVEIPNPTAMGSGVVARINATRSASESAISARSPVTPSRET